MNSLPSCILFFCAVLLDISNIQANRGQGRPNIVVLMSDDQDLMLGSMDVMHFTQDLIVKHGTTFNNAFTTSPICCPSRSSFLTGLYSHNHNVLTNNVNCSSPQWRRDHETRTFATYLERAGYATSYFGKYLNEYNGSYIPPGWQYWMGLIKNTKYYNYSLNHNDRREQHKDSYEKDYFTDLVVNRSMEYFRRQKSISPNKPILSVLSFPAPHGKEVGAPQYQNLYENAISHITPSFDYGPNNDKHWIVSHIKEPMDETQHRFSTLLQQKRLQTLRSVDDGIEKYIRMLEEMNELDNTYILYTSDHGFHIGQFRLAKGKGMPYDFDIRVPFYLRGPGIPQNFSIDQIVLNIDIAPTILGIAGVQIPETMDGRNFMALFERKKNLVPLWRDTFLVEKGRIPLTKIHMARPRLPSKQEKIKQACQTSEFRYPCQVGQEWTCSKEDEVLKLKKCKKLNRDSNGKYKSKKKCKCSKKDLSRPLSSKCRRRIDKARNGIEHVDKLLMIEKNRKRRSWSRKLKRGAKKQGRGLENTWPQRFRKRFSQISSDCKFVKLPAKTGGHKVVCSEGSQKLTRKQVHLHKKKTKMDLKLLELYSDCQMKAKIKKCKCKLKKKLNKKKKLKKTVQSSPDHPMKQIARQIEVEHDKRMNEFKEFKEFQSARKSERQLRKEKLERRGQLPGRCSQSGMTCFRLGRDRWVTNPIWTGKDRCYCSGSINNTYWCIRTINATANLLYCEFITGFVEYFDLNKDPYQLSNTYYDLTTDVHAALNSELAQLRLCKGSKDCQVSRNYQSIANVDLDGNFSVSTTESSVEHVVDEVVVTEDLATSATDDLLQIKSIAITESVDLQELDSFRSDAQRLNCTKAHKKSNFLSWKKLCKKEKNKAARKH